MRIPRIFQNTHLSPHQTLVLDRQATQHLSMALRMEPGQDLLLFNGDGCEYPAKIENIKRNSIEVKIISVIEKNRESPLSLHLCQGIAKGDRMDTILQKSTELGITSITPLFTRYCDVQLKGERLEKKQHHWQRVIESACEQCGRNRLPVLHPPIDFQAFLQTDLVGDKILLDPTAHASLRTLKITSNPVHLLIGPEGGFSLQEKTQSHQLGFQGYSMGPRVLRTETASMAAISVLQTIAGDF